MATTTRNPGAGNGYISAYKSAVGTRDEALWDDVVAGTGITASAIVNPSPASRFIYNSLGTFTDTHFYCYRPFLPFDCTDLAGATINSAVLRVYIVARTTTMTETLYVVGTTQASYSTLATSDRSLVGSTSFCDTQPSISTITAGAYLEFTLNAAGRSAIMGGNGRLALRTSGDFNSTLPDAPAFADEYSDLTAYYLAHGSSMPELVIDYTPAGAGSFRRRRPSGLYTR